MADREKVVLAYSGGLDTSICIKWLMDEHNMDVIAVVGEVGQEHEGLEAVRQKALRTGAIEAYVVDMREELVDEYLTDAIRANALYENKYPLLSALTRPVISKHLVRIAHEHNVPILIDGAQSAPHRTIDVQALDCDFFALSGHKMYGPTGIGVLYGKETWLDRLPPYMGGGEMIKNVSFEHTTFNTLPYKFEAGTPDYIATTGLARAIDFIEGIGMDALRAHEEDLTRYAVERLSGIEGMHIYGYNPSTGQMPHGVISFQLGNIHHLDMGTLLDRLGIAVRTGHHCAEPLMHRLGIEGTCRASFALYNTRDEVDRLASAIERVKSMF